MKIYVASSKAKHEAVFLDECAAFLSAKHEVTRVPSDSASFSIVWNGRGFTKPGPRLTVELGWLPRWSYQVSSKGINAEHDGVPVVRAKGEALPSFSDVRAILNKVKAGNPFGWQYTKKNGAVPPGLPPSFWLAPLQIEDDLNMKDAPMEVATNVGFAYTVLKMAPFLDAPIVFKSHPASRYQKALPAGNGYCVTGGKGSPTIYTLLASGRVRGVISVNSNSVHDALAYGVPSMVMGTGIWKGSSAPFYRIFPYSVWQEAFDLTGFLEWEKSVKRTEDTRYYVKAISDLQWTLDDIPEKLDIKIKQTLDRYEDEVDKGIIRVIKREPKKLVNVVAADYGWLFADLQKRFAATERKDAKVVSTQAPISHADAYIFLRAREAVKSPDPARTVIQMHDFFGDKNGRLTLTGPSFAWSLVHPAQKDILKRVFGELPAKVMTMPIGAPVAFRPRKSTILPRSHGMRVLWTGRDVGPKGVPFLVQTVDALQKTGPVEVVLLGEKLERIDSLLREKGHSVLVLHKGPLTDMARHMVAFEDYPSIYTDSDCLLITSESEAGPLVLFEALSCGLPVVSRTKGELEQDGIPGRVTESVVGHSAQLIKPGFNGFLADSPEEMAACVHAIHRDKDAWKRRRETIAKSQPYKLEHWISSQIAFALSLTEGNA